MSKPTCHVYNIIMGELYIDAEDQIKVTNYRTGETATINYIQRGWSSNPKLEGQIFDADNTLKWKIEGSWWDKLSMKNVETGQEVSLFSELPMYPNHLKMFKFNHLSIQLNYIDSNLKSIICPTDSRYRGD